MSRSLPESSNSRHLQALRFTRIQEFDIFDIDVSGRQVIVFSVQNQNRQK
ncbi:MAG: hypothetical protein QXL01_05830 [Thermoplasmatales archaeon]